MKRLIALVCVCACGAVAFASAAGAARHTRETHRNHRTHSHRTTKVSAWDEQWLTTSLEGDLFEIQGGKLAKSKSDNAAVTKLANRLIKDHTQSFEEGAKLARRLHIEVPSDPTPSEQWELQMLSKLSGNEFNYQYALLEVYDHKQDIQESSDEVKDGTNSAVRDEAKTELPMLREHLKLAEHTVNAVK